MTRHECEEKIIGMLEEIKAIYLEYNPNGKYLGMSYNVTDGKPCLCVNNAYWHGGEDEDRVLTVSKIGTELG